MQVYCITHYALAYTVNTIIVQTRRSTFSLSLWFTIDDIAHHTFYYLLPATTIYDTATPLLRTPHTTAYSRQHQQERSKNYWTTCGTIRDTYSRVRRGRAAPRIPLFSRHYRLCACAIRYYGAKRVALRASSRLTLHKHFDSSTFIFILEILEECIGKLLDAIRSFCFISRILLWSFSEQCLSSLKAANSTTVQPRSFKAFSWYRCYFKT
jgi:hypothetical protein